MAHRPQITAENYHEVYDYFQESRYDERFSKKVFAVSERLYAPNITIEPETREAVAHHLALGKGAMLAINHPSYHDPFVMAGALNIIEREVIPGFNDFLGFAKDSLFRGPTRPIFERTGCVPVFRQKNYPDLSPRVFAEATTALLDLAVDRLRAGHHVSLLPEGTTSDRDGLEEIKAAKVKSGVARIALKATDQAAFIIPVGIHYRSDNPGGLYVPRGTAVVFGEPITDFAQTSAGIKNQIVQGMQHALTQATDIASREL